MKKNTFAFLAIAAIAVGCGKTKPAAVAPAAEPIVPTPPVVVVEPKEEVQALGEIKILGSYIAQGAQYTFNSNKKTFDSIDRLHFSGAGDEGHMLTISRTCHFENDGVFITLKPQSVPVQYGLADDLGQDSFSMYMPAKFKVTKSIKGKKYTCSLFMPVTAYSYVVGTDGASLVDQYASTINERLEPVNKKIFLTSANKYKAIIQDTKTKEVEKEMDYTGVFEMFYPAEAQAAAAAAGKVMAKVMTWKSGMSQLAEKLQAFKPNKVVKHPKGESTAKVTVEPMAAAGADDADDAKEVPGVATESRPEEFNLLAAFGDLTDFVKAAQGQ